MTQTSYQLPFSRLRKFIRPRAQAECCELCGLALAPEHQHLLEPKNRRLLCSCNACAVLFDGQKGGRFRRVPRRIEQLSDFQLTEAQWENLHLPISLAFFYISTPAERVVAMYPSPAGATESLLTFEAWEDLANSNPILRGFEPDVEALLVNRVGQNHQYYRVPIDGCFKLVGLIRTHWRGLSGGLEVWGQIAGFFHELESQSVSKGPSNA